MQLVVGDDGKVSRDPAWFAGPRRRAGAGAEGRGAEPWAARAARLRAALIPEEANSATQPDRPDKVLVLPLNARVRLDALQGFATGLPRVVRCSVGQVRRG